MLEHDDEALKARIAAKAPTTFLRDIDRYVEHLESQSFVATEWRTGRKIVPDWFFAEVWQKHRGVALTYARRAAQMRSSVIREVLKITEQPQVISFAGGLPNPATFPVAQVREGVHRPQTRQRNP